MDLTPSTPAARVIDEVVPMGQGVHDQQAMMNNLGVHPAVYQHTEDGEEQVQYVEGQRASPLVLDAAIVALSILLAYAMFRRFL